MTSAALQRPAPGPVGYTLRIFLPFAFGFYLSYLIRSVGTVVAPELGHDLGLGAGVLGLAMGVFYLGFCVVQLPAGNAIDRWGSTRVVSALMVIAAVGCALTASAHSATTLALSRVLTGAGLGACLIGGLAHFRRTASGSQLAIYTTGMSAAAGLGGVSATVPAALLVEATGWRTPFMVLVPVLLACAGAIALAPGPRSTTPHLPGGDGQGQDFRSVVSSDAFRCVAPQAFAISGALSGVIGLWAVPWLLTMNGLTLIDATAHVMATGAAMFIGLVACGALVPKLARRGYPPIRVLGYGSALSVAAGVMIVSNVEPLVAWSLLGLSLGASNLAYVVLLDRLGEAVSGRAAASLNAVIFGGAFLAQWLFGEVVDAVLAWNGSLVLAYRVSFGLLLVLQTAAMFWFRLSRSRL